MTASKPHADRKTLVSSRRSMDQRTVVSGRRVVAIDESVKDRNRARAKRLVTEGQAPQHWSGVVGSTWWFFFTGPSSDEVWGAYLAHARAMLDSNVERPALLCIAHRAAPPTAEHRRWVADFIAEEHARLRSLVGFALVMDSPLHVLALKAINWIVKKPFPEKVCGSPITAARWLAAQGAGLDERELLDSLGRVVPSEHMWLEI